MRKFFSIFLLLFTLSSFSQVPLDSQTNSKHLTYNTESKIYTFQVNDTFNISFDLRTSKIRYWFDKEIDTLGYSEGILYDTISFIAGNDSVAVIFRWLNKNIIIEVRNSLRFMRMTASKNKEVVIEILYPENTLFVYKYDKKARLRSASAGKLYMNRYKIDYQKLFYKNGNVHYKYFRKEGYDIQIERYKRNGELIQKKGYLTDGFIYVFKFSDKSK